MRMPLRLTVKEREELIDATLELLGLSHVADTVVGDATLRGVSGGEKRRVSIGCELVLGWRHKIVVADSPTNGLDSGAAFEVVKNAKGFAQSMDSSFVFSVRQPSEELLGLFDTVCLMSRGVCLFFGPTSEVCPVPLLVLLLLLLLLLCLACVCSTTGV